MPNVAAVQKYDLEELNQPLWVHGLRKPRKNEHKKAEKWRDTVMKIILGEIGEVEQGITASLAEKGLGIDAAWYWYIARAEEIYSNGMFFSYIDPDDCNDDDGGVCPFDTGGLWGGKIVTEPILGTDEDRRSFFQRHDKPLPEWSTVFRQYIGANYTAFEAYVQGLAPKSGISEVIKETPPNTPLAWTWEGRIKKPRVSDVAVTVHFICTRTKERHFINWLHRNKSLSLSQKKRILQWINFNSTICMDRGRQKMMPSVVGVETLIQLGIKDES